MAIATATSLVKLPPRLPWQRCRLDLIKDLRHGESDDEKFFIKHPDDKGDHILVDESYWIVGIIDWEWTRTARKGEAFGAPYMMMPTREVHESSNELSTDEIRLAAILQEKGRKDLSDCVLEGRRNQRLLEDTGVPRSVNRHETLVMLFTLLRRAFGLEDVPWDEWKDKALVAWQDDTLLQALH